MKKFSLIFIPIPILILAYIVVSLPGTFRLAKKIKVIKREFVETARAPIIVKMSELENQLEYNGKLTAIVNKRNKIIKENKGFFLGSWKVSREKGLDKKLFIKITTPSVVFKPWRPR